MLPGDGGGRQVQVLSNDKPEGAAFSVERWVFSKRCSDHGRRIVYLSLDQIQIVDQVRAFVNGAEPAEISPMA